MNRGFRSLVKKEVKELLRDPKILIVMILVPSLLLIVMGNAVSFTTHKTAEAVMKGVNIAFIDEDSGWAAKLLESTIKTSPNARFDVYTSFTPELALKLALTGKYDVIIHVPKGFTENLTKGIQASLEVYSVVKGLSVTSTTKSSIVSTLISSFRENLVKTWLKKAYPNKNPEVMLHPLDLKSYALIAGKRFPLTIIASLLSQAIMLFVGPIILLSLAASIAAASMGVEKEQKTLETLLSLPVKRVHILLSKTIGSLIVAAVGTAATTLGLIYYAMKIGEVTSMESASGGLSVSEVLGLFGASNIVLVIAGIFLALFLVLVISIVVSSLTSSVREAQAIAGYIWLPVLIPMLIVMYLDYSSLSSLARIVIALLPFATPLLAMKSAFEGYMWVPTLSFIANTIYAIAVLALGAKWFEGERILVSRIRAPRRIFRVTLFRRGIR